MFYFIYKEKSLLSKYSLFIFERSCFKPISKHQRFYACSVPIYEKSLLCKCFNLNQQSIITYHTQLTQNQMLFLVLRIRFQLCFITINRFSHVSYLVTQNQTIMNGFENVSFLIQFRNTPIHKNFG